MLRKRIISLLISAVMLFSFSGISVLATDNDNTESKEVIYGNWHFNGSSALPEGLSLRNGYDCVDIADGILKLSYNGRFTVSAAYLNIDTVSSKSSTLPELVVEYKGKINGEVSGSYMSDNGTKLISYYSTGYFKDINGVGWNLVKGDPFATIDDVNEWHTYSIVYSNTDNTRSLYVDGEMLGTSDDTEGENPWYKNKKAGFTFKFYDGTKKSSAEFEYIKIYSPSPEVSVKAYPMGYSLDKVYVEFGTSIVDFSDSMVTVGGINADSVTLFDEEKQIYEVTLSEPLESSKNYDVVISGAKTSLGKTVSKTVSFTTRDKTFYIDALKITDGSTEFPYIVSGEAKVSANVSDEKNEGKNVALVAAQYDGEGFMNKNKFLSKTVSAGQVEESVDIDSGSEKVSAFFWEGIDNPVPVSDMVTYDLNGKESINLGYDTPDYSLDASVTTAVKDDYSGITVTVDTKDSIERMVGVLVKYKGNAEYAYNKLTDGGIVTFDIPLKQENIGSYSVTVGIEKGKKISVTPDVEYYSPAYIEQMMATKINAQNASSSEVSEFVSVLGEYMKLDTESLNKLADKDYAYLRLLSLRDKEENKTIETKERLSELFKTAVKMALIYEGIDTDKLISESTDLAIDDKTNKAFKTLISSDAKDYVKEKLKGVTYSVPSDMTLDVKKYTIIGGIYKASHYSIVGSIAEVFGTELGIDTAGYLSLLNPDIPAGQVINVEYPTLDDFKDALNSAITAQKNAEAVVITPPPVIIPSTTVGGGGGGGVSYSPIPSDDKKEEEKPPVKTYTDVVSVDWFYSDVMWATENGWFIGTSDTLFSPQNYLTWEQIAIVLKRMGFTYNTERGNEEILRGDFADILYSFLADKENYKNVNEWIEGTKMFIGNDSGNMMFDTPLTRAQCCTLLRRIENK